MIVSRGTVVAALLASGASVGCAAGPPHFTVLFPDTPQVGPPGPAIPHHGETSSVVVPPSADGAPWSNGCPAEGRAFIAYGDHADSARGTSLVYTEKLSCLGQPGCIKDVPRSLATDPAVDKRGTVWIQTSSAPASNGACIAGPDVPGSEPHAEYPHDLAGTDMMVARVPLFRAGPQGPIAVPGGRIVHFWLASRVVAPRVPVPDVLRWTEGQPIPSPTCHAGIRHVGVMARWSDDCGATWAEPTFIDFDDFVDQRGIKAFPMELASGGRHLVRGPGLLWGTDRFEIHADPFGSSPALYLAAVVVLPDPARGVPSGERRVDVVLRSDDGGMSWKPAYAFPDWGGGPKVMTSTESGRLFVGRCIGVGGGRQRFQLFWFDRRGTELAGYANVDYMQGGAPMDCRSLPSTELFGKVGNALVEEGIARVRSERDTETVRVAYGGVEGAKQVIYVVTVEVSREASCKRPGAMPSGCVKVTPEKKVEGEDGRSLLHLHLVATDRLEYRPASGEDEPSVLTFIEWPHRSTPQVGAVARFHAMVGQRWSDRGSLSVRGGAAQAWTPRVATRNFIGDYDYGAFYVATPDARKPKLMFLSQWPESDPALAGENHGLRVNVVEVTP